MQPETQPTDNWQLPPEQPSKSPYASPPAPSAPETISPVVTMSAGESDNNSSAEDLPAAEPELATDEPVRWQAAEYIQYERNALWFTLFGLVIVILMAAAIFLINSLTFAILVPIMAVALLVYLRRPPRILNYTLGRQGLHINDQLYDFAEFKGFGVVRDGKEYSIMLIPTKRFHQGVWVYFPEESGEDIVDILGARLPMIPLHLDIIDIILRKLRL